MKKLLISLVLISNFSISCSKHTVLKPFLERQDYQDQTIVLGIAPIPASSGILQNKEIKEGIVKSSDDNLITGKPNAESILNNSAVNKVLNKQKDNKSVNSISGASPSADYGSDSTPLLNTYHNGNPEYKKTDNNSQSDLVNNSVRFYQGYNSDNYAGNKTVISNYPGEIIQNEHYNGDIYPGPLPNTSEIPQQKAKGVIKAATNGNNGYSGTSGNLDSDKIKYEETFFALCPILNKGLLKIDLEFNAGDIDLYTFFVDKSENTGKVYYRNKGSLKSYPYIQLERDSKSSGNNKETTYINSENLKYVLISAYKTDSGISYKSSNAILTITDSANQIMEIPLVNENHSVYWSSIVSMDFTGNTVSVCNENNYAGVGIKRSPVLYTDGNYGMGLGTEEEK